jgi:hypothetical protein
VPGSYTLTYDAPKKLAHLGPSTSGTTLLLKNDNSFEIQPLQVVGKWKIDGKNVLLRPADTQASAVEMFTIMSGATVRNSKVVEWRLLILDNHNLQLGSGSPTTGPVKFIFVKN